MCAFVSSCSGPDKKSPLISPEAKYEHRTEKMTLLYHDNQTHAKNIKVFKYKTDQKSVYGKTTIHVLFPETQNASLNTKARIQEIKKYLKKQGYQKKQFNETDLLTVKGNTIPVIIKTYHVLPPICDSTLYQENHTHCAYVNNQIQMTEDVSVFFSDKPMSPVHSAPLIQAIADAGHTGQDVSGNDLEDDTDDDNDSKNDETGAPSLKDIIGGSSNPVGGGLLSNILPGGKK